MKLVKVKNHHKCDCEKYSESSRLELVRKIVTQILSICQALLLHHHDGCCDENRLLPSGTLQADDDASSSTETVFKAEIFYFYSPDKMFIFIIMYGPRIA